MNALCYKTVFSKRLGALVAVGEHATSQSKGQGAGANSGAAAWDLSSVLRYVGVLTWGFAAVSLAWSQTLPQGGRVSQGQVTISQSGQQMAITQSTSKAVVNWDSFDIGANAKVNIAQPSSQSVLLNRVLSDNPTQILGQLQANGQVVLVNPKGIVVGSDGSVSASAFTASTLNISDADFMAGNGRYTREGSTGEVVNKGRINVAPGGYVALLGARVSNEGQIIAPQGAVALGAAETVTVPIGRTGKIKLELTPASINASVANQKGGVIVAEGGQVYMQAAALGQAVASVLHSGHIDTSGAQAGAVHLLADGGQIKVDGSITANSSGQDDQGQLRKGGDIFIGRDEETGVLARTTDASGAQLESQRGFVETSGDHLVTTGTRVKAGEWLLDPTNITITSSASGTTYTDPNGTGGSYTYTAASTSLVRASDIQASLNDGTSVTIATSASGTDAGNINVNSSIAKTSGNFASLTLRAHNDIMVAANTTITSTSGNLNVTLNSDFDASGAGAIVMNSGSGITSNGGNITLGGGSAGSGTGYAFGYNESGRYTGVDLTGSTLSANGGNIRIKGQGVTAFTNTSNMRGVNLSGAVLSTSGVGNIQIDGIGGNGNVSSTNVGIGLTNGTTITGSSGGTVSLTGTGGNGTLYNFGVWLSGSTVKITSTGAISLNGTAGGSGTSGTNSGVMVQGSAMVEATGSGSVSVVGVGGTTTGNFDHGVEITGGGSVRSQTGSIQITGSLRDSSTTESGIYLGGTGTVASSGNGAVTLTTDSLGMESTSTLSAGTGTVTVQTRTASTLLDVGGTSADATSGTLKLGISSAELARISAGTVVLGRTDATANTTLNAIHLGGMGNTSGNLTVLGNDITVNDNLTKTAGTDATLSLRARGNINVTANKTITSTSGKLKVELNSDSDGNNAGAIVMNSGSGITSNGGDIRLSGGTYHDSNLSWAYGTATSPHGISLTGTQISAGGGNISLRGASMTGNYLAHGVHLNGGAISTTGGGFIDIQGHSTGTNQFSAGVAVLGASITGGSTNITRLIGTNASTGSVNRYQGVWLDDSGGVSSLVTSTGGNVTVTGTGGGGGGTSTHNWGVAVENGIISSGGTGTVTVTGTGGNSTGANNAGVAINGTAAAPIGISSSGGTINVTGTGGAGGLGQGIWFVPVRNSSIQSGNNAAINLTTDSFVMESGAINAGTGTVTIQNRTAGTLVDVGGADVLTGSPLTLGVSNAEINRVSAGTLKIGSTTAGNLNVSSAITSAASTGNLYLQTNGTATASASVASGAGLFMQTTGLGISNIAGATLTGTHISLDNTRGVINLSTGAITPGTRTRTPTGPAIMIAEHVTASGNLNLYGQTPNNEGILLWSGKELSGGNIQAVGEAGGMYGVKLNAGARVTTTGPSGNSMVKGLAAGVTTNGQSALQTANATLRAAAGTTLTLHGHATTVAEDFNLHTRGLRIDGLIDTYGAITLTGDSGSNDGFLLQDGGINVRTGSLNINGALTAHGGGWRAGVNISQPIQLYDGTSLTVVGRAQNTGVMTADRPEWGVRIDAAIGQASGQTTAGNVSITGYTSSEQNSEGVLSNNNISTGTGNITIMGQNLGGSNSAAVRFQGNLSTSGNITLQSVGGHILVPQTKTIGTTTSDVVFTGRNITLDNTGAGLSSFINDTTGGLNLTAGQSMGGSLDATTGAITAGSGVRTDASNSFGVRVNARMEASGNIHLQGNTSGSSTNGVIVNATGRLVSSGLAAQIQVNSNQRVVNTGAIRTSNTSSTDALIQLSGSQIESTGTGTVDTDGAGRLLASASAGQVGVSNASITGSVSASATGDINITNNGAIAFSAVTTNNGHITLDNTQGALSIDTVNGVAGVTAHGTGNVNLTATSPGDVGIWIKRDVSGHDVSLSGTANGSVNGDGIKNAARALTSRGDMSLTGVASQSGMGIYAYAGSMTSAGRIALDGTGTNNHGINLHGNALITSTGSWAQTETAIHLKGTSNNAAVSLNGVNIQNNSTKGTTHVEAVNGHLGTQVTDFSNVIAHANTAGQVVMSTNGGHLNLNTRLGITQNSNEGVLIKTLGNGNLTVPKIDNHGTGAVVVAAGSNLAAGTGTGGQVLTLSGNSITQHNTGTTYIYSGQTSDTGQLNHLNSNFSNLYYQGTSQALNTQFNTAYDGTPSNDLVAPVGGSVSGVGQVFFRSNTRPGFSITLNDVSKTYGDADPGNAALNTRLGNAYTGPATLSTTVNGNNFAVAAADVIQGLTGTARNAGNNVGTYAYTNISGSAFNTTLTAQPHLVINKANLSLSGTRVYDAGTTYAGQFLTATGVLGETFSVTGLGDASNLSSANVQSNQTLSSLTGLSLGSSSNGGLSTNYNTLSTTGSSVSVTPRTLTVTGANNTVTYNGAAQTNAGATIAGKQGNDDFSISGYGSGTNASNTAYADNLSVAAVGGTLLSNYSISYTQGGLTIGKANLTATGSKVYDAGTAFAGTNFSSIAGVNGEAFTATGSGTLNSPNVQSDQTLQSLGTLSLVGVNGALSSNYNWTTANTSASVTPRSLSVTGANNTVTYNGAAQTNTGATIVGTQSGDSFTISGYGTGTNASTTAYADNLSVAAVGGTLLSNYSISYTQGGLTIGKANLTATGSKVYDAGTAFAGTNFSSIAGVNGETFTATGSGTLASPNVQSAQTLQSLGTLSLVGVNGALASNYNWTTANTSVSVTPRTLTVTGANNTVTYNGAAQTNTGATIAGNQGSDSFSISGYGSGTNASTTAYADSLSLTGTGNTLLSNYSITYNNGGLTIGKANLTAMGSKVYDASTAFAGSSFSSIAGVNGETFTATGSGTLASPNVQSAQTLQGLGTLSLVGVNGALASNYNWTTANTSASVTPRSLSVTGANNTVTYNGAAQTNTGATIVGTQSGDSFTISGYGTGTNASTTAYADSLSVAAVGGTLLSNYSISYTQGGLTIGKANLTVTGVNNTVTYNGSAQTNSGATIVGTQSGDGFSISGYAAGTNAGSYNDSLTLTGTGGTLLSNYSIAYTHGGLNIDKANLTLSGTRVYDAGTTFAGQYLTASGVAGQTFSVTGSGHATNLASKNVQTNQPLNSVTGLNLGSSSNGGQSSNYNALSTTGSSVSVTPKALTATATASDKTYNATLQATVSGTASADIIGSDNVVIGHTTASFADANVARDGAGQAVTKTVSVSGLSLSGTDALNYSLQNTSATASAKITPQSVSLSSLTAGHKVYDGNVKANITGASFSGTVNGETLSLSGTEAGSFADKNVGTAKVVSVADVSALSPVDGTGSWNNYQMSTTGAFITSANITPKNVTIASLTASNKTYDGNTNATITTGVITTGVGTETLSVSGAGTFNNKNAGDNKTVTVDDVTALTRTDGTGVWSNYNLNQTGALSTTASIAPKAITLNGITAVNKVYDGGTAATASTVSAVFDGKITGDALTVQSTGVFADKNVGQLKNVSLSHVLGGADLGNYTISAQTSTTASITPKSASVSATFTQLTYNGAAQNQSTETRSGFVAGDTITVAGQASGKNAGTYGSGLVVSGQDATNYNITVNNANLVIDKANLTVTANAVTKTYDATLNASGTGTVGTLAGAGAGDVVNSAGTQAFLNANAGTNKQVRASGVTIKDASNADMTANYTINYVDNTTSVINKAALTVKANDDARFVGLADNVNFAGVQYAGLVGGETSSVLGGTLLVERNDAGNGAAGVYTGALTPKGLASNNYEIAYTNGTLTIVPADQLLISTTNQSVTYGTAPTYVTTAKYLKTDNSIIITLTGTGTGNDYTFSDGLGTTVRAVLKPYAGNTLASTSSTGHTVVGNYAIKDLSPTVTGGNFVGAPVFVGNLSVNTKAVTPNATGVSKVYDGTTAMSNVVVGLTGEVTGDKLSINGTGAFSQKNVGSSLNYTISNITLGGDDAGNYHLSGMSNSLTGSNGSITRAPLVLTSANVVKTYDRSTSASGTAVATNGTQLFGSDSLSGGTFVFDNKNAGTGNKVVSLSGVTVGDGNSGGNYTVSYVDNTTSTIWAKNLTASYSADNKTYNGNTLASVTGSSADIISGDTVSLSHSSATFANKDVGTSKTVTVNGIALGGADAGNYSLQNTSATSTANISAKSLTVSYTASHKVYDGLTHASVSGSSSDIVSGDNLGFTQTAHFEDKNAANGKGVSITQIGLSGADAGNYALAFTTASASANITPKDVSLNSITAAHKVYDGNNTASITSGAISTGVSGETLAISGPGIFSDANAANGKTVTVANVSALNKANGSGDWSNYNLTTTGSLTTTANITRKDVTLSSITAADKVYDGNNTATITSGNIATGVGTQTLSIGGVGTFSNKDAANNKTVTVTDVTALTQTDGTGSWSNYNLTTTGGLTTAANITRKNVTLTSITASNKAYDGSDAASIASGVVAGTVGTETLSVSGAGLGSFSDKNAANGKTVTVADVSALTRVNGANGGDWSNYQLTTSGPMTTQANITRKDVSLSSITADNKVYDGINTATITSGVISTGVGSETLAISGQGTFSDANAADNKVVTVAQTSTLTQTDGSGSWSNYRLTTAGPITTTANITRKNVSLSSITAAHKVYNGSDAAAITTGVVLGTVGTESLSVSGVGSFSDANAADGKTVSVTDVTALTKANGSGNWSNYNLTTTGAMTTQANITRKDVSLSSITALDKVYDGNNTATITSGAISTGVGSETLAISGSGTFADANAANGKTVTVANVTALTKANGTGNWSNYNLTTTGALTTTADISRKDVTLTSITAAHKVYDGNNTATITSGAINTGVGSETLGVNGSGTFSDANAGDGKTVTVANVTALTKANGSGNWNNYNLITTGGLTTTANITRKDVSLSSITALDKVYDGNNAATITSGAINTGVGSETLAISGSGTFSDANAADGKTVSVTDVTALTKANGSGNWNNYNLTTTGTLTTTANITRKDVSLSGITALDKVYDGNNTASITSASGAISTGVGSETLGVTGSGTFSDANAANGKTVTVADVTALTKTNGTGDWNNYNLTTTGALTTTANITRKNVSLSSITALDKVYDGNNAATITSGAISTGVGSETLAISGSGTFSDANAANNKTVTVANVSTLTKANGTGNWNNYNLTTTGALTTQANISRKDVSLSSITAAHKVYDGNNAATITSGAISTGVSGETLAISGSGTFSNANAADGKTVTVDNVAALTKANGTGNWDNYNLTTTGALTTQANISRKDVSLSSITAAHKVYDGNNTASITSASGAISTGVGSETLGVTGSGTFSDANAANNKTVTVADVTALTKTNGTGDWNNYNLTTTGALTTTANITRKDVSLSSITALDKVYDGNNAATITSGAISTGVGSETLAISGSGTFSNANAANNKTVTVANVSTLAKANGTGNWSNYNLTTTGVMTTTADITRKNVTLDSITAADKVYDGTAVASITGGSVSGTLTGESLSVSGQGSFADKHVASNKTVTVQDVLTLSRDNGTGDWRNYQLITTGALTDQANITPKALSVSGITAAPKTYDGNTQATVATSAVVWDGRVAGDNLSLSSTGAFSDKNVGTDKVVTLTHTLGGTDLGNYTVTTQASTTANITPKALALSAGPVSKTYDGSLSYSTSADDLTALSAQLVSGDTVTAASLAFTDKNAGTGNKSITFNSATLEDGNNGGNYSLTLVGNNTSTISKANITVALQGSVEKTYDGLDSATVNSAHFATSGWVSGEGASITQTAAVYANQNVSANPGNGTVNANLQLSHYAAQANTDLNNYSLASSASGAVGKINPAALNIKVNDTKMFVTQDANLAFDQGFSYTGLVNGESAANALTGGAPGAGDRSYSGAQFPGVGSLNGVYGLSTVPTALNGNYSVSVTPGNLQVIPADKLLVTINSQSDAYGQRKAPQAGVAASGTVTAQYCLVQSNCNGANLYTLNLNSSNGSNWQGTDNTGNTITLGTGLAGTPTYSSGGFLNAGNHTYALASLSSTVANQFNGHEVNGGVLTITPLQTSFSASDVTKVYDGNNTLVSATLSPSGTLSGDALQATFASGSFTDKNAGPQGFTLSGLALQGADQANYVLGSAQLSGTGTITPKAITVSGLQAQDKVYDGSTQASVQTSGAVFNGIVAGDQLSVTATGQFDTRHAGTHKAVSLSSSFGGADLDNYSITPQASSTASITPAPLVVTASAARKTYDGNTTAPGVGTVGALAGAAAGDTVAFAGTQAFTNKNAGTGKTVTVTGVRLVDASNADVSGNYAITYVNSQNGTIDRANASIAAQASSTVYNGSTQSQTGLTYSGFVAGDDVQATGLASGRNAGSYLSSLSATGADAGNYNITFNNASLNISRRPASLSALGQTVVYNGLVQSLNGTQGSGFVAGDALSFGGLPSGRNVGQYSSAMTVSGADAANYDITLGNATLTITPKSASVTARPERVTYNGQTQQQSAAVLEGFVAGDDIRVSGLASGRNAGVYSSNVLASGQDAGNYSITYQQGALTIDKAPLQFVGTSAADKVYDGNTQASVTAGTITGLVGSETLNIDTVQGQFDSAEMGTAKPVTVVYGLSDGANGGLVANYQWSPVTVKASITGDTSVQAPSPEVIRDAKPISRLSFLGFGGLVRMGATTGQLFYALQAKDTRTCSPLQLEGCICEQPKGQSLEVCYPAEMAQQAVQLP